MNFIFKILNRLLKLPVNIIKKIFFYYCLKQYDKFNFVKDQNNRFNEIELDREKGVEKILSIKKKINMSLNRDMTSEHENLFACISLNNNFKISNILEIGTFDGFNALLLSELFPNSNIDTIDLPSEDNDFINFYERKKSIDSFVRKRNSILSLKKNINFIEMNSLNLINHQKKYDLIWVDGAHGYPVVTIDIINSLNLLNDQGLILCDDVFIYVDNSDKMYKSLASYETLNGLSKQSIIEFKLFYKRLGAKYNCLEKERKYIAVIKKK